MSVRERKIENGERRDVEEKGREEKEREREREKKSAVAEKERISEKQEQRKTGGRKRYQVVG